MSDAPTAEPLTRVHMPTSFGISLDRYTSGRSTRLPSDFGPAQDMRGFEPTYRNIVDYIVRITHRIWEGGTPGYVTEKPNRDVDYILATYHPQSAVFDDYGLQRGNAKIVSDTHHTTGAFSDITLDAEEVVWAGNASIGFHTSHLTRIAGTNDGPSNYGPATNRTVSVPVIANCVAKDNMIFLEHVLYNTSGMLVGLGLDLHEQADRIAHDPPPGWPRDAATWAALRSAASPARPLQEAEPGDGFDPDRFAREALATLFANGPAPAHYDDAVRFEGTTGRAGGLAELRAHADELRDAFGGAEPQVDEVYWMGNDADGHVVSTRWSMDAHHAADDPFGRAEGKPCQVWGITQIRIRDGRITDECFLFNEFDVMLQVRA